MILAAIVISFDSSILRPNAIINPLSLMKRSLLSTSLGLLLPVFLALVAHAEKTPFDLKQIKLPDGFHIAVFADNIDGARMLTFTPGGVLLVSESGEGKRSEERHVGKESRSV